MEYENKNPGELAGERLKLAYEHGALGVRLVEIQKLKAKLWPELRLTTKSDTQCDRLWDQSEEGIKEMELKKSMKSKEIRMSALKTYIEVLILESRNQI